MIKDITKSIIDDYLEITGKDISSITADEYLNFRLRAEEEIKGGLRTTLRKASPVQRSTSEAKPIVDNENKINTVFTNQVSPIKIQEQSQTSNNLSNLFALAQNISG